MAHKPLLAAIGLSWVLSATMVAQSANPRMIVISVPVTLVLVGVASILDENTWGNRAETFIATLVLVLVAGDLIPYWVVAYLSNSPYGGITPIDTLAGLVAGLITVTLGWYLVEYLIERSHNRGNDGDSRPALQ